MYRADVLKRLGSALAPACWLALAISALAADDVPFGNVTIERGQLSALFRDNAESPQVLSGIDALYNTRIASKYDAFDPDGQGASAGMNFEHIIAGHATPNNMFTPRQGKFQLRWLPGRDNVRLVRRAEDDPWKIDCMMTYTVVDPYYIDLDFRCVPRDASLFGARGYAVFFFANYMNSVPDCELHFRAVQAADPEEHWVAAGAPSGHADYNGGGTYQHRDARPLEYDDDHNFKLNLWSYDDARFTQPFYYGRALYDMTLIVMFDRAYSDQDEIRFSLFKFKLDKVPRPAWDWQYVIHHVEEDREYGFRARLAWKKFINPADCMAEYERWNKSLTAAAQ